MHENLVVQIRLKTKHTNGAIFKDSNVITDAGFRMIGAKSIFRFECEEVST